MELVPAPVELPPPSLKGSLSISYSLFDLLGFDAAAAGWPRPPNNGSGSAAAAGWKELKKSSPPKSMSSFLALSDLTCPFSYLRANEMPPAGIVDTAAGCFLPSYILPLAFAVSCFYVVGT